MRRSVLTLGTFDGVHRGHQKIFKKVSDIAEKTGHEPAAITFNVPPRVFFFPTTEPELLTTVPEKTELLRSRGMRQIHVLNFNSALARVSAGSFFKNVILKKARAAEIVVGYNFGFGRNREGDTRFLELECAKHGIPVHVVPPVTLRSVPISSGRIREVLKAGNLKNANALLGYPYFVTGRVVRGARLGTQIGYPTANLEIDKSKIVPLGVFAVRATMENGKVYGGMANAGFRPTVRRPGLKEKTFEVHLFGFKGNLYGRTLRVELISKIRDEKTFPGITELKRQIEQDEKRIKNVLDSDARIMLK